MSSGRAEMKVFWSAKPSQAERTHEWDVSKTNWDLYPSGTALTSPEFSCAGLDGLRIQFYPKGSSRAGQNNSSVRIYSVNHPGVVVKWMIAFKKSDSVQMAAPTQRDLNRKGHHIISLSSKGLLKKISVEVMSVVHKYQPEEVQQVPCFRGGVLRVVKDSTIARESFFVVGCEHRFKSRTHNSHLGKIGEVMAVERLHIQLKHHDGALLLWGHGALLPCFTSAEVDAMKVPELKEHLENRGEPQSGLKGELSARLKAAEKCDTRATGVGGVAISAGAVSGRILSNTGRDAISAGAVSNAGDLADAPTEPKKRPRTDDLQEAPDPKRPRTLTKPLDTLLGLFIAASLDSSEVVLRCGECEVGGAVAGSSSLSIQAGEVFEVEVRIKTRFATFDSELADYMMREIILLPDKVLVRQGEPRFLPETGVATFPVRAEKAGDIAISAAIMMPNLKHLPPNLQQIQQGTAALETHTIGGRGCVISVRVRPGAMQFQSIIAKTKDGCIEQLEFELGEQVELLLPFGNSDHFGNTIPLPHSETIVSDFIRECHLIHQDVYVPLQSLQLALTDAGIVVRGVDLSLLGQHRFRIKYFSQEITTTVQVAAGMPHSLQLIGEGRAHVLRQWRWGCKAHLLNKHGHPAFFSKEDFPTIVVQLVPSQIPTSHVGLPLDMVVKVLEQSGSIKGNDETGTQELELFHIESVTPARKGQYQLQAKVEGQSGALAALACDSATIHLGLPLDPSSWEPQDLAESIRCSGVEVPDDVLTDVFGDAVSGKDIVARGKDILIECLLRKKEFANRSEMDNAHAQLKQVADDIVQICTLAKLGKGKFKSSVAKCISEGDLSLEAEPFDKGGTSEIFKGDFERQSVAVKVPMHRDRGLKVDDDTSEMMKDVERELTVTKACSHQHVVSILGLMVGPGRIGIVMEYCDTSLAKYIQAQVATLHLNWPELIRYLMDGAAGLHFIHMCKNTTHGDVKPDNLLIQQGRLKVSDFGLATVRRTMTKFTGDVSRKGTSFFMAPEMLLGERGATQSAIDVWGFGCCIANAVTGEIPFSECKSEQELVQAMRQKQPVYLKEQARAGSPKKLLDLIDKCCQYGAENRPKMEAVEIELRSILQTIQNRDGFELPPSWQHVCSPCESGWTMVECLPSSKDYELIKARLMSDMGDGVTLRKIEMNINMDLFRRYHLEREKVLRENNGAANEAWLWHAVRIRENETSVLQHGFDTNYCGLDFEYYGAGIYLAHDSKLSNQYAASSRHCSYPSNRSMLLCRVACGKIAERSTLTSSPEFQQLLQQQALQQLSDKEKSRQCKEKIRELLRMPKNRTCPSGSHSQLGVDLSHTRKSKTEIIVNRSYQAFPAYRISYTLSRKLPHPLGEGRQDLKTFEEYTASDFHRLAVSDRVL